MLEMLKERKAALEARGKKGFTLMEMLIVIAIIAVLVAIAIPVLGAQLEKSRDTASVANMRSAYAEAAAKLLNGNSSDVTTNTTAKTRSVTITGVTIETQAADEWSGQATDLAFTAPADDGKHGKRDMTFTWDASDNVKVTMADPASA